jgi:LPS sulfotransferase NodH
MTRLEAPFVAVTFPRSGSSWLMDTLDSHPQVLTYGELLRPGEEGWPGYGGDDIPYFSEYLAARRVRPRAVPVRRLAYLRSVFRARPGLRAVGFKLMYGHLRQSPEVLPALALRRVRIVHLVRANLLGAVVSYDLAKSSGVFHPHRGEPIPTGTVVLDASRLRERLEHMEWAIARARSSLERFRLPRIDIAYEELLGRREETLERVMRFLGVDPAVESLHSRLARTGSSRGLELVDNVEDVRTALQGTRFEWMLGDGLP